MSASKKIFKTIQNLVKPLRKLFTAVAKTIANGILRGLLTLGKKRPQNARAGFALSTTLMVVLVVTLLSTALVLRSFDRSKTASNNRQEQVIQNTATPAIDRARAKLDAMLDDPYLPKGTPSNESMLGIMAAAKYTFADEIRLKLAFDIDKDGSIVSDISNQYKYADENLNTAWKFPVDTDGNGKYDSFTIYGLFWRNPDPTLSPNDPNRRTERQPLEARSLAQDANTASSTCAAKSAATATATGDWYPSPTSSESSKSFYAYAATIPITQEAIDNGEVSLLPDQSGQLEPFKGNKAFAGLEYEQDRYRESLNNNAVWYQDDLILIPGGAYRLNGRVFTNANLMIGGLPGAKIRLYQVSSHKSCFYFQENAKINVGGNVANADVSDASDEDPVDADLYQAKDIQPQLISGGISSTNKSITQSGGQFVAYNDAAYRRRIQVMLDTALGYCGTCTATEINSTTQYPDDLKASFNSIFNDPNNSKTAKLVIANEIKQYLKDRTRRIPYAEIGDPDGIGAEVGFDAASFATYKLQPKPNSWSQPYDGANLTLNPQQLEQTKPELQKNKSSEIEKYIGDRVIVGNNLPALWKQKPDDINDLYVGTKPTRVEEQQILTSAITWTDGSANRYRTTQVQNKTDIGESDRNGFWEDAAALDPIKKTNGGGLRIITGAGIYVDGDETDSAFPRSTYSFLPTPKLNPNLNSANYSNNIIVWPDLMPMSGGPLPDQKDKQGDLLMRASAVYHYVDNYVAGSDVAAAKGERAKPPIACVSSYYDPSDPTTAKNASSLPWNSAAGGKSNNGIVYSFPGRSAINTYTTELQRQAKLVFPDGRFANQPLANALVNSTNGANLDGLKLSDYSALDTAVCALAILDKSATPDDTVIAHGVIKESAFLDARELKAIDTTIDPARTTGYRINDPVTIKDELNKIGTGNDYRTEKKNGGVELGSNYDLPLEQRQPLEIRVTDINIGKLAATEHKSFDSNSDNTPETEYLLPNSGVLYASREDSLPDISDPDDDGSISRDQSLSPSDFRLDPSRRSNGIRIVNDNDSTTNVTVLARGATGNTYRKEELGLTLVTNNPAYIKGHFNLHLSPRTTVFNASSDKEIEEFNESLDLTWSNFYSRGDSGLNQDFACRKGQCLAPGDKGDQWRPANIVADAITLQSVNFQDGFRSYGDFDIRNNAGYWGVEPRLANGFYENSFITSSYWWDDKNTDGIAYPYPLDPDQTTPAASMTSKVSSYLTNGVTPVQRRVPFSEYVMEMCLKVPVSSCGPQDWVVGYDADGNGSIDDNIEQANNYDLNKDGELVGFLERDIKISQLPDVETLSGLPLDPKNLGAGTTARPAFANYQRYPRRVAFLRNELGQLLLEKDSTGNLVLDSNGQPKAKPIGPTADNLKNGITYASGATPPATASNALWFATTNNNANPSDTPVYGDGSANLLYYRPINTSDPKQEQYEFLLPDVTIPDPDPMLSATLTAKVTALKEAINGTSIGSANAPADFTACIGGKFSQEPLFTAASGSGCDSSSLSSALAALQNDITDTWAGGTDTTDNNGTNKQFVFINGSQTTVRKVIDASADANKDGAVVYTLPSTANVIGAKHPVQIVLQDKHNSNTIFVIRASSKLTFGNIKNNPGVQVVLDGVDPNNVFWELPSGVVFTEAFDGARHKIVGNLVGSGDATIGNYTDITGRVLGFTNLPSFAAAKSSISAITSTKQPLLEPVLQISSPDGSPPNLTTGNSLDYSQRYWLQQPTSTFYNAAFVAGDSPNRPQEYGAGLNNLVRLQENWCGSVDCRTGQHTLSIKGTFIQLQRSSFATGPFMPYPINPPGSYLAQVPINMFGADNRRYLVRSEIPFYTGPNRQWGFDVGLLSQSPDLFSKQFTNESSKEQNYYRQVGRDDKWIKTLLCAAEPATPDASSVVGTKGTTYTKYAVPATERPSDCPGISNYKEIY